MRDRILELRYEGNPGIVVMKNNMRPKLWWLRMDKAVEKKHVKVVMGVN